MEILGTKCPSITSICIQSAPAASSARTSSPSLAKSADKIDGATTSGWRILPTMLILLSFCRFHQDCPQPNPYVNESGRGLDRLRYRRQPKNEAVLFRFRSARTRWQKRPAPLALEDRQRASSVPLNLFHCQRDQLIWEPFRADPGKGDSVGPS